MVALEEMAAHIRTMERQMVEEARALRAKNAVAAHRIEEEAVQGTVAAVDSGFAAARYHGVDVVAIRAAAVQFSYTDSALSGAVYLPGKHPEISWEGQMGLDDSEAMQFRQLLRLQREIDLAQTAMEQWKPDTLLLDGSLRALPSDMPGKGSTLWPWYERLNSGYAQLYATAQKQQCMLIGIVKDSRARRVVATLPTQQRWNDSVFFHYYLNAGERSGSVPWEEGSGINVLYMKASKEDIPLRIEFLNTENEAAVAERAYALCMRSPSHAYPPPLVEADLCAMVQPDELEQVERKLQMHVPSLHALRRNARPFR